MRTEVRQLMVEISRGVLLDEGFADELAEIAHECRREGNSIAAQGMTSLSRNHRIRAMEGRARIAALKERYAQAFNNDQEL